MKVPLDKRFADALTFQAYGPRKEIEGVFHKPLKLHRAMEGSFMEFMRVTGGKVEDFPGGEFDVRQVSVSQAEPGRINAFHVHPKETQDEFWCVIGGKLLVWLVDVREGSPTVGVRRPFVLTGEAPAWLYIPAGVAHGYQAGPVGATLLYVMDSQFNLQDPNEGRLLWDHFGQELWEPDRG